MKEKKRGKEGGRINVAAFLSHSALHRLLVHETEYVKVQREQYNTIVVALCR